MIQRYCFPDEATSLSLLNEAGYMVQDYITDPETGEQTPDGDPHFPHNMKGVGYDLIVLGSISRPTDETTTNDDGEEVQVMETLTGWHVNIKLARNIPNKDADDPEAVDTLRDKLEALDAIHGVNPATPARVFS